MLSHDLTYPFHPPGNEGYVHNRDILLLSVMLLFIGVGMQNIDVYAMPSFEDGAGICSSFAFKVTPKQLLVFRRPKMISRCYNK